MLLADRGATVLLVAREDRLSANAVYVHYLLALRGTPWELRHISVALPRESPSLPSLAASRFRSSRFERPDARSRGDHAGRTRIPIRGRSFAMASGPGRRHPLRQDAVTPRVR